MSFNTTEHEKESLEAHVDLCALRYQQMDNRLQKVEDSLIEIRKDVLDGQKSLRKTIITTSGSIIVAILGLIGTILMLFVDK
jgi:hypothetical protein